MVIPVVVVELPDQAPAPADIAALLSSCSLAAAPSTCDLAPAATHGARPRILASLHASDDSVWVEVSTDATQPNGHIEQRLKFRQDDSPAERWRSVGLTMGTLAGELAVRIQAARAGESRAGVSGATAPAPVGASFSQFAFAVGGAAGPGLAGAPWRWGGWGRGSFEVLPWHLALLADGVWSGSPKNEAGISASWSSAALGAGAFYDVDRLRLHLALDLSAVAERVSVGVDDPHTERHDAGRRWVFGGRAGASVRWPAGSWVGGEAAGDLYWMPSATVVQVESVRAAESPNTMALLRLGVFVAFR